VAAQRRRVICSHLASSSAWCQICFCSANLRNTSSSGLLSCTYNVFLRPLGMNTTWNPHCHFGWPRIPYSPIRASPPRVLGASRCIERTAAADSPPRPTTGSSAIRSRPPLGGLCWPSSESATNLQKAIMRNLQDAGGQRKHCYPSASFPGSIYIQYGGNLDGGQLRVAQPRSPSQRTSRCR